MEGARTAQGFMGRRYHTPNGEPWSLRQGTRKSSVDILDARGGIIAKGVDPKYGLRIIECVNALVGKNPDRLAPLLAELDQTADLGSFDPEDLAALLDLFNTTPTEEQQGA